MEYISLEENKVLLAISRALMLSRGIEPFSLFSRRFIGIHVRNPLTRHDKTAR